MVGRTAWGMDKNTAVRVVGAPRPSRLVPALILCLVLLCLPQRSHGLDLWIPSVFGRRASATVPDRLQPTPSVEVEPAIRGLKVGGDDVGTDQDTSDDTSDDEGAHVANAREATGDDGGEEEDIAVGVDDASVAGVDPAETPGIRNEEAIGRTDEDEPEQSGVDEGVAKGGAGETGQPPRRVGPTAYPRWCGDGAKMPWDDASDTGVHRAALKRDAETTNVYATRRRRSLLYDGRVNGGGGFEGGGFPGVDEHASYWHGADDPTAVWELPLDAPEERGPFDKGNATMPGAVLARAANGLGEETDPAAPVASDVAGSYWSGESSLADTWGGRRLLGRDDRRRRGSTPTSGAFSTGYYGCRREFGRARNENTEKGAGKRVARLKAFTPGQEALVRCISNISACGSEAAAEANALPSIELLRKLPRPVLAGRENFRSCAIVGNAGHLSKAEYGAAIDRHDVVMRFNVLAIGGKHVAMVGKKTNYRVLNHIRSLQACCKNIDGKKQANKLPEKGSTKKRRGDEQLKLILWHPGAQRKIMADCRKSNPGAKIYALAMPFIQKQVAVIKAMRTDLMKLGFGPFTSWKQLTSGAHGIFTMAGMCDTLSLYGFTSFPPPRTVGNGKKTSDQYGGRSKKAKDAVIWHDWTGESFVWRLMHASAKMTVCSV